MSFQTEYEFTLPNGFVDKNGTLHKNGVMRLATAADEIFPMREPQVQMNPAYLTVFVLARVVVRLGQLPTIDVGIIERLFAADYAFLQEMYNRINSEVVPGFRGKCPKCGQEIEIPITFADKAK